MSTIRASSKKTLPIFDEDNNVNVEIMVRQVTRTSSDEYGALVKKLNLAKEAGDEGAMLKLTSELIMLRVCPESKAAMNDLFDRAIGFDQYKDVLDEIETLFKRSPAEKKPDSQNSTEASSSAKEA